MTARNLRMADIKCSTRPSLICSGYPVFLRWYNQIWLVPNWATFVTEEVQFLCRDIEFAISSEQFKSLVTLGPLRFLPLLVVHLWLLAVYLALGTSVMPRLVNGIEFCHVGNSYKTLMPMLNKHRPRWDHHFYHLQECQWSACTQYWRYQKDPIHPRHPTAVLSCETGTRNRIRWIHPRFGYQWCLLVLGLNGRPARSLVGRCRLAVYCRAKQALHLFCRWRAAQ